MTYLIAQIWLFIAVAAAIGLLFGWLFHGGVSGARLKELRHSLAHAKAEVDDQRREAAELAARAERRGAAASPAESSQLLSELRVARDRIGRLESETRNAQTHAARYAEEADELRHRIAELTSRGGGASAEERAAWRERVTELEQESDSLRRRLDQRDAEADEALHVRIAELEAENHGLQDRLVQLEEAAVGVAPAPVFDTSASDERIALLEAESEALRRQLDLRAETAVEGLDDRISELETEAEGLRARLLTVEQEIRAPLESQIAALQSDLEAASAMQGMQAFAAAAAGAEAEELAAVRAERDGLREQLAQFERNGSEIDRMRERIGSLEADLDLSRRSAEDAEARATRAVAEASARPAAPVAVNGMEEVQTESARLKWRNSYLTTRIHFLESRLKSDEARRNGDGHVEDGPDGALSAARAEIARLEAKNAELEKAVTGDKSGQPAPNVEQGGGSLEWRNRYLASRVRYLEQQLEGRGVPAAGGGEDADVRFKLAEAEEKLKELVKLKARLSELERAREAAGGEVAETGAKAEAQRALEWRVRYLSSRVKYLEDRLSKAGVPPSDPDDEDDKDE